MKPNKVVIYVAAIDPGKMTGICTAEVVLENNLVHELTVLDSSEIGWEQRFYGLEKLVYDYKWNHIIVEDFRLYQSHSKDQINSRFPSSQLIGVAEYLCWKESIPIHFQMAATRTRAKVTSEYYAQLGGLTRNGRPSSQHRWDAFQHLKYFVTVKAALLIKEQE